MRSPVKIGKGWSADDQRCTQTSLDALEGTRGLYNQPWRVMKSSPPQEWVLPSRAEADLGTHLAMNRL
jgi:hypothetical protein